MRKVPPKINRLKTSYVLISTTSLVFKLGSLFHLVTRLLHSNYAICLDGVQILLHYYSIHFPYRKINTGMNTVSTYVVPQPSTDNVITKFKHWDFLIYKVGRVVTILVNFAGDMEPTPVGIHTLITIPEMYRPIIGAITTYPTQINSVTVMAEINTDSGRFGLYNNGAKITNDWICRQVFTYISKQ